MQCSNKGLNFTVLGLGLMGQALPTGGWSGIGERRGAMLP